MRSQLDRWYTASRRHNLFIFLILTCLLFIFIITKRRQTKPEKGTLLPHENRPLFDSLFYDAGVDVTKFHTCLKMELARIMASLHGENVRKNRPEMSSRNPIALVVGVEYGSEVVELGEEGYDVIGVEPFPEFVTQTVARAADAGILHKINIYTTGAGAERGKMNITYYQGMVSTPIVLLDDIINNRTIDILSIDVHGGATNLDVLMGGKVALGRGLFRSIWVEIYPEREPAGTEYWGGRILSLLQEHDYILYDVQWVGGPKTCERDGLPSHLCNRTARYDGIRPLDSPKSYMDAMSQVLDSDFQYLQTDIIALPRLLAARAENDLQTAAEKCGNISKKHLRPF